MTYSTKSKTIVANFIFTKYTSSYKNEILIFKRKKDNLKKETTLGRLVICTY